MTGGRAIASAGLLVSALLAATVALAPAGAAPAAADDTLDVLLIGNSYTMGVRGAGQLDEFFAADPAVDAALTYRVVGGQSLAGHAADPAATIFITDTARYAWDVVVLQDHSLGPATASRDGALETLDPGGPHLLDLIAANHPGARTVLFMTWPRKAGNDVLASRFGGEPLEMLRHIRRGYRYIAGTHPGAVTIAPVGDAFWAAIAARPDLDLYAADGSHASTAGSYLAAAVLYETVTGASAVGNSHLAGLAEADARFLQRVASRVTGRIAHAPLAQTRRALTPQ